MSATCELLRGHDFNSYDGNVLELAVSREVVGVRPMILSMSVCLLGCACVPFIALVNERAPSGLCMCPFYCSQVIDRCAYSGSSCLSPFYDMFWTICGKERILDNLPVKRSGAETKMYLKMFHIWESLTWFILMGFFWFLN